MTSSSWSLVVPVLIAGLVLGVGWVIWWRRRAASEAGATRDRELLLADLRARQEDLYQQIRQASEVERAELELAAARNLRAIEEAGGTLAAPASSAAPALHGESLAVPVGGAPVAARRGPSAWLGFVGGVACAGLLGLLILWAQRDATPREDVASPMQPAGEEHPTGTQLSDRDAEALEALARRVEDDPTDVMARKQFAVGLLSTGQFFPAFEQAEILLASNERDPDGLYVAGMVRMRMGQEAPARDMLLLLIEDYPDHVPALTALGVLELRTSGLEAAEALWDRALAASGGRNPEIERLVATARAQVAGVSAAAPSGAPSADAPSAGAPPSSPRPAPAAAPAASADAYTLRIDLAPGASAAPGAVLFVSLRQGDAGPPAAVKRMAQPRFPLTVTLSAADSMLGRPLPTEGTVSVRIDNDGSASTREDGEPAGAADMKIGESASVTLQ